MPEPPLQIFEKLDPQLLKLIESSSELTNADGALPRKFKLLVAMALDADNGATQGVKSLAQAAIKAGATKEEITEVLRVVHHISGVGGIYTAAPALKELF